METLNECSRPGLPMMQTVQYARRHRSASIREASFDDHPAICALELRHGLESKPYEEWVHLWRCNPAYGPKRWPIGWVLENRGDIVGYVGNIPLLYELDGAPLIAAATRAWVVDHAYRNYSVPLLQHYFTQQHVDIYLGTSTNSQSAPILGIFNSVPVPVGAWNESAFWVTDKLDFASSFLKMKGVPLGRYLSYGLSGALFLREVLDGRGAWSDEGVTSLDQFDDRFDAFWETLRREKPHSLLAVRTQQILDWHFKYAILKGHLWVFAVIKDSKLAAYSVFCRQDSPKFGLRRVRLIDFQTLGGENALLLPMLQAAHTRCQRQGIHMLEFIGVGPELKGMVASVKPYKRRLPSWLYYYKPKDDCLGSQLANPANWNPSGFDGDFSL